MNILIIRQKIRFFFFVLLFLLLLLLIIFLASLILGTNLQVLEFQSELDTLKKNGDNKVSGAIIEKKSMYSYFLKKDFPPNTKMEEVMTELDAKVYEGRKRRDVIINGDLKSELRDRLILLHALALTGKVNFDPTTKTIIECTWSASRQYTKAFSDIDLVYFFVIHPEHIEYIIKFDIDSLLKNFNNTLPFKYDRGIENDLHLKSFINLLKIKGLSVEEKVIFNETGKGEGGRNWFIGEYFYENEKNINEV